LNKKKSKTMNKRLHTYEPTSSFSFREREGGLCLCKQENAFYFRAFVPSSLSAFCFLPSAFCYDAHGNMTLMSHLSLMSYDYNDRLFSAGNGTFTSYYNYDTQGNRTRKVVDKGSTIETRYYVNGYELYKKEGTTNIKRKTVNIADDEKVFVRVEQETGESEVVRYQYDNHIGSACLELDGNGDIISYEEYHPFGTTSYRAGKGETEVSLKRYKYNGKERDEETGLYAYGMRYYAAWVCRFISVDPLQFEYPELTPFQYASNNPVTMIDLDGAEGVNPDGFHPYYSEVNITSSDSCPLLDVPYAKENIIPNESDQKFISALIDKKSENYSKDFHDLYKKLEASDTEYSFVSWNYDGNRGEDGLFSYDPSTNKATINFTKEDNPQITNPVIGASKYRVLFEETFHAGQFESSKNIERSCVTEAQAWKFSASAPGTKESYYNSQTGNFEKTLMGRFKDSSVSSIAMGFKIGMAPTKKYPGTSSEIGVGKGMYHDFKLGTKNEMRIYFPILNKLVK